MIHLASEGSCATCEFDCAFQSVHGPQSDNGFVHLSTTFLSLNRQPAPYHHAMATLGNRLRNAREDAGISRDEMALRLGKAGPSTVSNWENNIGSPNLELIEQIARMCGTDPGFLAFGTTPGSTSANNVAEASAKYISSSASEEMATLVGLLAMGVERGSIAAETMRALTVIVRNLVRK